MRPASPPPRPRPRGPSRSVKQARRRALLLVLALALLVIVLLSAFAGTSPQTIGRPVPASASRLLPAGPPKPLVIAVRDALRIQLPVNERNVTAIGYHGAGEDAVALEPVGRQANEGLLLRMFHRIVGRGGGVAFYRLGGGGGPPTSALDVGGAPGVDVYSPVDGTVVGLRSHLLNGRKYGVRIEIQPSADPSVVVVVHHLRADPLLTVGSPLAAGTSKIGTIMDFSPVEKQSLARYTQDAGNHVSVEVRPAATLALR
jgi:hypothetical protein